MLPPTLGVEKQDGGVNSPPAILSVLSGVEDVAEPGPLLVGRGTVAGSLNLELIDTDLGDAVFVRIFVDYNNPDPTPARASCTAATVSRTERSCNAVLAGLCTQSDLNQERLMTVVVFDRPVLETGMPLFQAMAPGGLSTSRTYRLQCQ